MGYGQLSVRRRPRAGLGLNRRRTGPRRADAGSGADRLFQPSGRCGDGGSGRRRRGVSRHRPRHCRKALSPISKRPAMPTCWSPSAAPRSAITTWSRPCCDGAGHGAVVLEDRHAARQAVNVRAAGGRRAFWACLAIPSPPSSAHVCFWCPCCGRLGLSPEGDGAQLKARSAVALEANGAREHYMRATARRGDDGLALVTPVRSQDSSLLSPLAEADCACSFGPRAPCRCPRAAWSPSCRSISKLQAVSGAG